MSGALYSPGEVLKLKDLWLAGVPPVEIGRQLSGRTAETIYSKARRMGLPQQPKVKRIKSDLPISKIEFDDLWDVRLPPAQRKVMATLLEAHPFGLTHKEIGKRVFDDTDVIDPQGNAVAVCRRLDERLQPYGWRCSATGDRKGVKLHPVKEDIHSETLWVSEASSSFVHQSSRPGE